ncbi:Vacuolar protein sorting-associated protein 8 [Lithohypha guttulata]|uniref:Vacuolar protein sorting-associated protein 8 n=1 Tax=Lithohypha guttulata TaxID=1690604 RepID=UPI002DDE92FD|nr:Vacuolar protein sorting-associated protein 8 [Lithohypha guttulata]
MATFYKLMGVASDGFDPEQRFVTSWLLPPSLLAAYRLLFALFDWATIITIFIWDGINDPDEIARDFSYFTALTWWGLTTYLTISGLHTLVYSSKGYTWLHRSWPRPLQVLHSLFYTTIVVFPFIVTIVYWAILYDGPWFSVKMSAFANVSRHALNSLAALLEIILPATSPPPWLHVLFLIVLLAMYLGLAYVTHVTQGFYVYSFLNPARGAGQLAGYIVGIAVACVVIFLLARSLVWARKRFTGPGKRSKNDMPRHNDPYTDQQLEMSAK